MIRHCEACAAIKPRQATIFSACRGNPVTFGTSKAKSLDCRGRLGSLAKTSLVGSWPVYSLPRSGWLATTIQQPAMWLHVEPAGESARNCTVKSLSNPSERFSSRPLRTNALKNVPEVHRDRKKPPPPPESGDGRGFPAARGIWIAGGRTRRVPMRGWRDWLSRLRVSRVEAMRGARGCRRFSVPDELPIAARADEIVAGDSRASSRGGGRRNRFRQNHAVAETMPAAAGRGLTGLDRLHAAASDRGQEHLAARGRGTEVAAWGNWSALRCASRIRSARTRWSSS